MPGTELALTYVSLVIITMAIIRPISQRRELWPGEVKLTSSDPTSPQVWGYLGQLMLPGWVNRPAGPASLPLTHPHLFLPHPHGGTFRSGSLGLECFSLLTMFQPKCPLPQPLCPGPLFPSHLLYFSKAHIPNCHWACTIIIIFYVVSLLYLGQQSSAYL